MIAVVQRVPGKLRIRVAAFFDQVDVSLERGAALAEQAAKLPADDQELHARDPSFTISSSMS